MVREFHTHEMKKKKTASSFSSALAILSHVLRRKTLYRKFVKKKSGDEVTDGPKSDAVNDEVTL